MSQRRTRGRCCSRRAKAPSDVARTPFLLLLLVFGSCWVPPVAPLVSNVPRLSCQFRKIQFQTTFGSPRRIQPDDVARIQGRRGSLQGHQTRRVPLFAANKDQWPSDEEDDKFEFPNMDLEHLNQSSEAPILASSSPQDETERRIEEQQQQIDMLMKLVQQQQTTDSPPSTDSSSVSTTTTNPLASSTTPALAPLKAMMFIDGTWLYYSIHERQEDRCPIAKRYGIGWQTRYSFDWAALPRIICQQLQQQQPGWSSSSGGGVSRPVEVVRASVFTSVKKETSRYSNRLRMFQDMNNCNYDVHMMETVGAGEKCVDIQLAVEMLHFATVPGAYDVAILVSGDKDFLPALVRTRQKARQVCIVSMRPSCNRALLETPNVKDYEPIWIEDYLDQLMIEKDDSKAEDWIYGKPTVSAFSLKKVIYDFIDKAPNHTAPTSLDGRMWVSSRELGRYLKRLEIGGRVFSDEIKEIYGGLFQFLTVSGCFEVMKGTPSEGGARRLDPTDKTFWASLRPTSEKTLLAEAKRTHLSSDEKKFFESYSTEALDDGTAYSMVQQYDRGGDQKLELPKELTRDFSKLKVAELKNVCKERGLPVSGTKAALLERIDSDVKEEIESLKKQHKSRVGMKRFQIPSRIGGDRHSPKPEKSIYLEKLVTEYLRASGGEASSRDVGRYLAASPGYSGKRGTKALTELKSLYGGLGAFLADREDMFAAKDSAPGSGQYEFRIALRKNE